MRESILAKFALMTRYIVEINLFYSREAECLVADTLDGGRKNKFLNRSILQRRIVDGNNRVGAASQFYFLRNLQYGIAETLIVFQFVFCPIFSSDGGSHSGKVRIEKQVSVIVQPIDVRLCINPKVFPTIGSFVGIQTVEWHSDDCLLADTFKHTCCVWLRFGSIIMEPGYFGAAAEGVLAYCR